MQVCFEYYGFCCQKSRDRNLLAMARKITAY